MDTMDYFNGSAYGQIPQETSQYSTGYSQAPAPWTASSTYAPWGPTVEPGELGQWTNLNNQARDTKGYNWQNFAFGVGGRNPYLNFMGLGLFDMAKKKRSSPEFYAPSYQGSMFTPEEGLPEYYTQSPETINNQTQNQLYAQQAQDSQQQNDLVASLQNALSTQNGGGYDYNYGGYGSGTGQQGYVGQQENAYGSFYNQPKGLYNTFKV